MKTGQNRAKVKTCFKNYIGLTTIVFATLFCLTAEGQYIKFDNSRKQAIVDFKPEVKPNSQTLVEYMVSDDLVNWNCEKVGIVGPDGQVQWILESGDENVRRRFIKFVQTDISEASEIDNDGDFISSAYELLHGMDPLDALKRNSNSNGDIVDAVKVNVADTEIAAGGFNSELYQTKVTVDVGIPNIPIRVWLKGKSGKLEKPNGDSFVADEITNPSEQALQTVTDSDGIAKLVLTSSEVINDSCCVLASIGDITNPDVTKQVSSAEVRFMQGDMTMSFDRYPLRSGGRAKAIVRRFFKGKPLVGHRIQLSVDSAKINDEVLNSTESDSLQDLIAVGSGDDNVSYYTNENGECLIDFDITGPLESLRLIGLTATDSSQTF